MNQNINILLVDDEVLFGVLLKKKLNQTGFKICRHVTSGEKAIQSAQKEKPDLILMDVRLAGDINGIEAVRQIKSFLDVPVIFITGYNNDEIKQEALKLKPVDYLIKPILIEKLEKIIQAHFL